MLEFSHVLGYFSFFKYKYYVVFVLEKAWSKTLLHPWSKESAVVLWPPSHRLGPAKGRRCVDTDGCCPFWWRVQFALTTPPSVSKQPKNIAQNDCLRVCIFTQGDHHGWKRLFSPTSLQRLDLINAHRGNSVWSGRLCYRVGLWDLSVSPLTIFMNI